MMERPEPTHQGPPDQLTREEVERAAAPFLQGLNNRQRRLAIAQVIGEKIDPDEFRRQRSKNGRKPKPRKKRNRRR